MENEVRTILDDADDISLVDVDRSIRKLREQDARRAAQAEEYRRQHRPRSYLTDILDGLARIGRMSD